MRALPVVNPGATATTKRTRNVLISALANDLKLEVAETLRRGHADRVRTGPVAVKKCSTAVRTYSPGVERRPRCRRPSTVRTTSASGPSPSGSNPLTTSVMVPSPLSATTRSNPSTVARRDSSVACALSRDRREHRAVDLSGRSARQPLPAPSFHLGLDLFALRRLRVVSTLRHVRQFLSAGGHGPRGPDVVGLHDVTGFTLRSQRPLALQVDGDYVGERQAVTFRARPRALRIVA